MSTPFSDVSEVLFLLAERARRGWFYVGLVLAGALCLILLEVLTTVVTALLMADDVRETVGFLGVFGYAAIPGFAAVVSVPWLIVLVSRRSALRIDAAGVSKVWSDRTQTVPWAAIDRVQFNSRRSYLLLVLKPGGYPAATNGVVGERAILIHSLGHALWSRRRPAHPGLIVDAVERFAPGKFNDPWNPGKGRAKGAGASA
ncbi:PH domain-containing protein [Streptomyces sp. ITFR-6]|uniref:PH domain-containing protein n=1 Tax=Streptomyces sp. ITFR-6 TaxID=3075197 RepID=UPI0028896114|nr:PH domain-containing protein [Streptomyces sp. ITFR-6]WNI31236.1 PH domain-containing protein [Streptomyces sp. ITFR-6]